VTYCAYEDVYYVYSTLLYDTYDYYNKTTKYDFPDPDPGSFRGIDPGREKKLKKVDYFEVEMLE
jgi:hypothetical protein